MKSTENKIVHFIATHSKTENYLNNIVRNLKINKSDAIKALNILLKNEIIISAGRIDRKEVYLINPDKRGLVEGYFTDLFTNLTIFEKSMNDNLDKIKNQSLFRGKDPYHLDYENKETAKILFDIFQTIDLIFTKVGALPFLQIADLIEKNDENNSKIQKCQDRAYNIISKVIHRLKKEHPKDNDMLELEMFLGVKSISEILFMEGKAV